jgi:hypothetical protein
MSSRELSPSASGVFTLDTTGAVKLTPAQRRALEHVADHADMPRRSKLATRTSLGKSGLNLCTYPYHPLRLTDAGRKALGR